MLKSSRLDAKEPIPCEIATPKEFKENEEGREIMALIRSSIQHATDEDGNDVVPGPGDDLVASEAIVVWQDNRVTMIRTVSTGELWRNDALKHLEDVVDAYPRGGRIHMRVANKHVAEGRSHVGFHGLSLVSLDERSRIYVPTQQRTVQKIEGEEFTQIQMQHGRRRKRMRRLIRRSCPGECPVNTRSCGRKLHLFTRKSNTVYRLDGCCPSRAPRVFAPVHEEIPIVLRRRAKKPGTSEYSKSETSAPMGSWRLHPDKEITRLVLHNPGGLAL
jgi:hypothetical protein